MKTLESIAALTAVLLISIAPAGFASGGDVVAPWERGQRRTRTTARDTRPPKQLPATLRRAAEPVPAVPVKPLRGSVTRSSGSLERRLIADARRAAEQQVSGPGKRNYFRVGFYYGMLDALGDERIGRLDFRLGLDDGLADREARRIGRRLGSDAAAELGSLDAESAVAEQFRDLESEPVFAAVPGRGAWAAPPVSFDLPGIDELFAEFPLASFSGFGNDHDLYLAGWDWDATRLYHCRNYTEFYGRDWDSANRAFGQWERNARNARLLAGLPGGERSRLRAVFADAFVRRIDQLAELELTPAWNLGLDQGWAYGRFIHEEMDYRAGFVKGFRQQASLVAKAVFRSDYPREYEAAYHVSFDRWANTAVPEIGSIHLLDGNDDGVFEPGERVIADVELINFGGAPGRFTASLDGAALSEVDSRTTELPRRSTVMRRGLLEAVIDGTVRPRTRTQLQVRVGTETKVVALSVSRPLQWVAGSLRLTRDNLAGLVGVELDVKNISRRPRAAEASLTANTRADVAPAQDLPVVRPQGTLTIGFDLAGLSALDLIAGIVSLDVFLDADGVEQDRISANLAETASDLASRDLPRLVRRMVADGATASEATRVRDLVLRRLRADWRAAVRANGNPYKHDFRSGGDRTALGELVQLAATIPPASARDDLLAGLSSDVLALAKDLPGPHPLLRKYVNRLARRLP
jgi:hypothetical protein